MQLHKQVAHHHPGWHRRCPRQQLALHPRFCPGMSTGLGAALTVLSPLRRCFLWTFFSTPSPRPQVSYHGGGRVSAALFPHPPLTALYKCGSQSRKGALAPFCAPQVLEQAPLVLWSPVWGSSPPYPISVSDLGYFRTKLSLSTQESVSSLGSGPHLLFWAAPQERPSVLF